MIRRLSGRIISHDESEIVIDVGGVGYVVAVSPHTIFELEGVEEISLWTYLAVRENALDLYGFITREELNFFELLLSVSGIGPKSALGVLNIASLDELRRAIIENNPSYLTKVSGVGKKSAEKIVLELKDKIEKGSNDTDEILSGDMDAIEALQSLGYPTHTARDILRSIPRDITETGERVRAALKKLGS
jgi:holliday junction DNA helicase RuvA